MTITKKLPNGNFFLIFLKKTIDKSFGLWYNKDNEREVMKMTQKEMFIEILKTAGTDYHTYSYDENSVCIEVYSGYEQVTFEFDKEGKMIKGGVY